METNLSEHDEGLLHFIDVEPDPNQPAYRSDEDQSEETTQYIKVYRAAGLTRQDIRDVLEHLTTQHQLAQSATEVHE